MNWKIIPVTLLMVFSIQGCGGFKTVEMSAVLSQDQQKGYMETITSQKKHFVSLAPYPVNDPATDATAFILFVKNCGENSIDISTKNISANFFGNTRKWASKSITIFSQEKLIDNLRRVQSSAKWYKISALKTVAYHTSDGNGNYTGSDIKTFYDHSVSNGATDLKEAVAQKMLLVEELVLQPRTLQPGEGGGGLVVCDTGGINSKSEGSFRFVVSVDGEQHEFTFNRSFADRRQDHYEQKK